MTSLNSCNISLNSYKFCVERINNAIGLAVKYGGIDGDSHKAWVINEMVKALAVEEYDRIVAEAKDGEHGLNAYEWKIGNKKITKNLFTYYAEGRDSKGDRCLCYGLNASDRGHETADFAEKSFISRYGFTPYRVEVTAQSLNEVLKQVGL